MKLPNVSSLLGICAALLAASPLQAGSFAVPAEGPLVFRRDRLPLDADTMLALSNHLCVLAQAQGGETPADRRACAQMLALSLALQPGFADARRLLDTFAKSEPKPKSDAKQLEAARSHAWQLLDWLTTAGADAHALASCLGDVLVVAEPKHPGAEARRKLGEQGAWRGWVEPLEAFSKSAVAVKNGVPDGGHVPVPEPPSAAKSPIVLATATVSTPLWTFDKPSNSTLMRVLPIHMKAKLKDGNAKNEALSCSLDFQKAPAGEFQKPPAASDWSPFKQTSSTLVTALTKEFGQLPSGVSVGLTCGDDVDYLIDRNHAAISAAAVLLMHAAVSGCEPSATVIGEVQTDGSLKLPPLFWDKLRCLPDAAGARLVLPMDAAKYLPAILTLEQPGFFFSYEVLLAANLHDLIERSAKKSEPELAKISTNFLEIRSKLGNQRITEYAANRFVRLRLDEVAHEASFHASARMLLLQGSGKRPALLPRNILADELRRVIRATAWISTRPVESLKTKPLNDTYEACLRDVDHLERYTEIRDRDLLTQGHELLVTLRSLARATRGHSADSKSFVVPWRTEFNAFNTSYQKIGTLLNQTADDG